MGEPFSQPRMWLCLLLQLQALGLCGPSCMLADPHAALHTVVLPVWAVSLLWRSWFTPEQRAWSVPPTRNPLSYRVGVDMGLCLCTGTSPAICAMHTLEHPCGPPALSVLLPSLLLPRGRPCSHQRQVLPQWEQRR